jgi:hypothetical protein
MFRAKMVLNNEIESTNFYGKSENEDDIQDLLWWLLLWK